MRQTTRALYVLAVSFCLPLAAFAATSLPASDAFAQWLVNERSADQPPFTNPQALAIGLQLAQARSNEMRTLMESNPEEFVTRAMPKSERAQLPPQIQSQVEHRVLGRGTFSVACSGLQVPGRPPSSHSGYDYEVQLNGLRYKAF